MSYIPAIFYAIRCDRCLCNHEAEYEYYTDESDALESAEEDDWIEVDGKHYCPCCYHEEDDEKIPYNDFPPMYRIARAACQKIGTIPHVVIESRNTISVSSGYVSSSKLVEGVIDWMNNRHNNGSWGAYTAECVSSDKFNGHYKLVVRIEYKQE